jgi:hypothetical protein
VYGAFHNGLLLQAAAYIADAKTGKLKPPDS